MYILIVEDHAPQARWIHDVLVQGFPNDNIERITTELGFRDRLDYFTINPPDIIIMDLWLPWTIPSENMRMPPDDVSTEGVSRAGIRCRELLLKRVSTKDIPVIFYTLVKSSDFEHRIPDHPKRWILSKDFSPDSLINLICEITGQPRQDFPIN